MGIYIIGSWVDVVGSLECNYHTYINLSGYAIADHDTRLEDYLIVTVFDNIGHRRNNS